MFNKKSTPSNKKSFTEVTEVHEPISYALIVVDSKNEIIFQKY